MIWWVVGREIQDDVFLNLFPSLSNIGIVENFPQVLSSCHNGRKEGILLIYIPEAGITVMRGSIYGITYLFLVLPLNTSDNGSSTSQLLFLSGLTYKVTIFLLHTEICEKDCWSGENLPENTTTLKAEGICIRHTCNQHTSRNTAVQ